MRAVPLAEAGRRVRLALALACQTLRYGRPLDRPPQSLRITRYPDVAFDLADGRVYLARSSVLELEAQVETRISHSGHWPPGEARTLLLRPGDKFRLTQTPPPSTESPCPSSSPGA